MTTTITKPQTSKKVAPRRPVGTLIGGDMQDFFADQINFFRDLARQNLPVAHLRFLYIPMYVMNTPEGFKQVLQTNNKNYVKEPRFMKLVEEGSTSSLFTTDGEDWLWRRRLMQPMFHRQVIANFGAIMTDEAQKLVEQWHKATRPVEIEDEMMNVTMQIIGRAMFSVDIKANAPGLHHAYNFIGPHIVQRLSNLFNLPLFVPTRANRQYKAELQTVLTVLGNIIEERQRTGELKHDLLDMLLAAQDEESQRQFSKSELMAEMSGIMFAGHETTATTLTWAMLLLCQNPAVLAKLQAEVDQVLTGRSAATIEDTQQLEYTKMVIQETLRLYPAAYLVTRLAVADDEVEGYHIPAGKQVGINIYGVHHHPDYWPEPEQFRPERFSPEGLKQQHKLAYIPFLTGPRRCIGEQLALAEAQIVLATIVKNFNFQLVPGQHTKPVPKFALRTRDGLHMQVVAR